MLDALFGAALLAASGRPAIYTPPGGPAIQTRCYVAWETVQTPDGFGSHATQPRLIAYLPAAAASDTARGTIMVGAITYIIDDIHEQDEATISYVVRRQ